jgi:hypothetical protein
MRSVVYGETMYGERPRNDSWSWYGMSDGYAQHRKLYDGRKPAFGAGS